MLCGGIGDKKTATAGVQKIADSVKLHLTQILGPGKTLHPYKVVSYKTQVVAGMNYFIKVEIDEGKECLHLRVFQPLGDNPAPVLARHQESHSKDECYLIIQ